MAQPVKLEGDVRPGPISAPFNRECRESEEPQTTKRQGRLRFWLVLTSLVVCLFIAVLESYAITTALPIIVSELHSNEFLWVSNAYGIANTVLLPLSGGLAEIFGRRIVILSSIFFFVLGSAICGAAISMTMLLAGRAIQGAGAGGILSLVQIILSDLVSLQERGTYNGLFGLTWALAAGIGPLIGGVLARPSSWRWLFYLNIPVASVAFVLIVTFLSVPTPTGSLRSKVTRIDFFGNILIMGATFSSFIALSWAGVTYPWSSPRVIAPLIIGVTGLAIFFIYEWRCCKHPVVPISLLSNRTSLSGYLQIGFAAFVNVNLLYYLPVYYQACKDVSPLVSGIDVFGLTFSTAPFSILTGVSVTVFKVYRPQLWLAWGLMMIGSGLLITVSEVTSRSISIGYQVILGTSIGIIYSASYFPVLAPLPISANAHAIAFFVFWRTFTQTWGFTIGGAILQNGLINNTPQQADLDMHSNTAGLIYSLIPEITSLAQPVKDEVRHTFSTSLKTVWITLLVVSGLGLISSLCMTALPLHSNTDENWAMREPQRQSRERTDET